MPVRLRKTYVSLAIGYPGHEVADNQPGDARRGPLTPQTRQLELEQDPKALEGPGGTADLGPLGASSTVPASPGLSLSPVKLAYRTIMVSFIWRQRPASPCRTEYSEGVQE